MPWLLCGEHGRECESGVQSRQDKIRSEGESVLIVKGRLISGPWRCDDCNVELKKGAAAWLYVPYPRGITERMDDYDFSMECDYFALTGKDRVALYGAPWPGGTPAQMLRRRLADAEMLEAMDADD